MSASGRAKLRAACGELAAVLASRRWAAGVRSPPDTGYCFLDVPPWEPAPFVGGSVADPPPAIVWRYLGANP